MSKLTTPRVQAKLALTTVGTIKDVMISYDQADEDITKKLREKMVGEGIRAWLETEDIMSGADIFARIGQAVVDSSIFMFVMSRESVQSKICQDQLALAYVSNKSILPVALLPNQELLNLMDNGMRLELAGFEWFTLSTESLADNLKDITNKVFKLLEEIKEKENKGNTAKPETNVKSRRMLNRSISRKFSEKESKLFLEDGIAYWARSFGKSVNVAWERFRGQILTDFKEDFDKTFGEDDTEWLLAILHRELDISTEEMVNKDNYTEFCTIDDQVRPLWMRIQDQARESYAMREVFKMDSSVRVQAIENLGKFKSATVIDALRDLLSDKDPNVQAVAIISLARTGANDDKTVKYVMQCLHSRDRIVREASCLSLGVMKATVAIEKLVDLWRNDIISNVREAALAALRRIGGDKADEAIRVTTVLEKEIRHLKTS
ncbi:uncharacterized protein LOC110464067 [Mizuhopecten yessoensis]|uniref:TIR domain-containing protein n=1 Tax=Mizuhopecten yessoensis TaxID=6573 RepID=A0A210PUT4_MIZYE|nr:uncharacterized protein LOC110464067 [Mizuhopecten yessoensis]XP_021374768.1 uncharacterized protein LOC110464067 [Mizuhopecten yessoensis]OWF40248.1 hypothetical protein KP79_PYT16773 [Mizuhopecten yessoensis]